MTTPRKPKLVRTDRNQPVSAPTPSRSESASAASPPLGHDSRGQKPESFEPSFPPRFDLPTYPESRFLSPLMSQRELLDWAPFGRTTLYSLQDEADPAYDPSFPAPTQPMGKKNYWVFSEVAAWLDARIAAGRKPTSITTKRG